jgi:hypothetical protein
VFQRRRIMLGARCWQAWSSMRGREPEADGGATNRSVALAFAAEGEGRGKTGTGANEVV